ncbi:MAG: adenylate/guanylate cyclase domain-containing protein [Gammaproteobacteria bacterium]|nr:adenylate/guanylate cyclase domain-containing protein [Gammaproteobacteria bacterium]
MVPVSLRIVLFFSLFILASSLTTNYISLLFTQMQQLVFSKELLIKDLKSLYNYANVEWEISQIDHDRDASIASMRDKSRFELERDSSIFIAIGSDGEVLFSSLPESEGEIYFDALTLSEMFNSRLEKRESDFIFTSINGTDYFGVYSYNHNWEFYLFRGEESYRFFSESRANFIKISVIALSITLLSILIGILAMRMILRFISTITAAIMEMIENQRLTQIPLQGASNDEITYLGMAFNALASNVDNLMRIFKKFTDREIVARAYAEKDIKLEGEQRELVILFTDIKGYTFMTETLGVDIIRLINIQYSHAIQRIYHHGGTIGSIIGDALLAVFGVIEGEHGNKSHASLLAAYELLTETDKLKLQMQRRYEALVKDRGALTEEEERIYRAVQLEVGVGIDGGNVFYGTIGSNLRMTSTVIGDRVNASSRLEGLTRIYAIPIICSDYIVNDVHAHVSDSGFTFINIDRVQVKGKTEGIPIYWPLRNQQIDPTLRQELALFSDALNHYYRGDWSAAKEGFDRCNLGLARVFQERTALPPPPDWEGVWVLTSK